MQQIQKARYSLRANQRVGAFAARSARSLTGRSIDRPRARVRANSLAIEPPPN